MVVDPRKNLSTALGVSAIISDKVSSISTSDCAYYGRVNSTGFGFIRSYEGIPENILVNLVVTLVDQSFQWICSAWIFPLDSSLNFCLSKTTILGYKSDWWRIRVNEKLKIIYLFRENLIQNINCTLRKN